MVNNEENNTATQAVIDVGKINFTGNIIPHLWYQHITLENGKPDLLGIILLSEIVSLYNPDISKEVNVSYSQLSKLFGVSKRQVIDAIVRLEKKGIITRVFRTIKTSECLVCSNVLFIEIHHKKVVGIGPLTSKTLNAYLIKTGGNDE